jgi:hypothetical protein
VEVESLTLFIGEHSQEFSVADFKAVVHYATTGEDFKKLKAKDKPAAVLLRDWVLAAGGRGQVLATYCP